MVLADDLRQRLARRRQRQIDEAVAKAVVNARATTKAEYDLHLAKQTDLYSRELDAWMSRRLAAERSGEPFSEPMPNLADYLRLGDDNTAGT